MTTAVRPAASLGHGRGLTGWAENDRRIAVRNPVRRPE